MEPIQFPKVNHRARALELIKELSFRKGDFTLSSGKKSNFYLDMKPTMFNPEGCTALATLVFERIRSLRPILVGGLEMGAVPLISPISMVSFRKGQEIPGFFVRKEAKTHGTKNLIETAAPLDGSKVVILDDITTTGKSAMDAVDAVRSAGAEVVLVLSIVDREEGAVEFYEERGIPFEPLFRVSELMAE